MSSCYVPALNQGFYGYEPGVPPFSYPAIAADDAYS